MKSGAFVAPITHVTGEMLEVADDLYWVPACFENPV